MLGKIVDSVEEFFLKLFEKIGLKFFTDYYREHKEGMRYLVFGALSTVVNFVVYDFINLSTTIRNVIAWVVAVMFAYITNKAFVFFTKAKDIKDLIREIISFFGARVITLVIETIFLYIFIDKFGFNDNLMKIISSIFVIILNFIFSKLFIFKKEDNNK